MAELSQNIQGREVYTYVSPLNNNRRAYYDYFDDMRECSLWARKIEAMLMAQNAQWASRPYLDGTQVPEQDFQGSNDLALLNNPTTINQFLFQPELTFALEQGQDIALNTNFGASTKTKGLKMTSMPIGVFNFGSASKGLYRKQEFFSPEMNMVVDSRFVQGSGSDRFMIDPNGRRFDLDVRQTGTTEMLKVNPTATMLQTKSGVVYTDPIQYGKVRLQFATTFKKVYLKKNTMKNVTGGGQERYVDIYVFGGANGGIDPINLLYGALPAIIFAEVLSKQDFKIRILKQDVWRSNGNVGMYSYTIKDYGEPMDYNRITISCADSRIFRWEDFKVCADFGMAVMGDPTSGFGAVPDEADIDRIFNNYKYFLARQIRLGRNKSIINKNFNLHINGTIEKSNANEATQLRVVKEKVKEMIDRVLIEFKGSDVAVREAIERDIATMTKPDIIQNFREALARTNPTLPSDVDLRLPDQDLQRLIQNYTNNEQKLTNIIPTL